MNKEYDSYLVSMLLNKNGVTTDMILDDLIGMNCRLKKKERWVNEITNYSYKKFKLTKQYRNSVYDQEKAFISIVCAIFSTLIVTGILNNLIKTNFNSMIIVNIYLLFVLILLTIVNCFLIIVTRRNDVLMIYKIIEYYLDDDFFKSLDLEYINSFNKLDRKSVNARKTEIIDKLLK